MNVVPFPAVNTGVSKSVPPAWAPAIDAYLRRQAAAGRPRTTIGTRRSHLARLARAMDGAPFDLDPDRLSDWFSEQRNWRSNETRRSYRNTIRSFYQWAYRAGHITTLDLVEVLPYVKPNKPSPRPAPDKVWADSIKAADARTALMLGLASVGLRRGEVAVVSTDDVTRTVSGYELLVHGKGDKKRVIPISDELAADLLRGGRGHTPLAPRTGYVFPGSDDGHLSPRWVGRLCSRVMPGLWTMHTVRHRCATKAFRKTRNLRAVQKLLGHESVATTEIYTAVDDDEVRAAMMAAVA